MAEGLPDAVGGICWMAVDNPGQSPRIPIFCGTTELPEAFNICGQRQYDENAVLWQYRRANKLATVAWQRTKKQHLNAVLHHEGKAFSGLKGLQDDVMATSKGKQVTKMLNAYTQQIYEGTAAAWRQLEATYWQMFGMGF